MRKRKNLEPRLEAVGHMIVKDPTALRGSWRDSLMPDSRQLWVELGCGMGRFAAACAAQHPDLLLIAVEKVAEALVVAAEKAAGVVKNAESVPPIPNLRLVGQDASDMETWFAPGEIDRLYIQFCDPWPKKKQSKRRLTYRTFLAKYAALLSEQGALYFKSDNQPLVAFTKEELELCGWELVSYTTDWHRDPSRPADDLMTEYEQKWAEKGQPIGRIVARPPRA